MLNWLLAVFVILAGLAAFIVPSALLITWIADKVFKRIEPGG